MLARMNPPNIATLRTIADLHGLPWTDAELEAALPAVASALTMLASLEDVAVGDLEPTTHFRIV
jgi:hypothetical protein